jgi:hypothetical protein
MYSTTCSDILEPIFSYIWSTVMGPRLSHRSAQSWAVDDAIRSRALTRSMADLAIR